MRTALDLANRLCQVADAMVDNRDVQMADDAIRGLRDEVRHHRSHLSENEFSIDYEAACLIDCIAELAYARSDKDRRREERALMYVNTFRTFLRIDAEKAARKAVAGS